MATLLVFGFLSIFVIALTTGSTYIDCDDGGFYIRADPKSANHFYKCDNGKAVKFSCPEGLIYNPKNHVCDWPRNVKWSGKGGQSASPTAANNGKPSNNAQLDGDNYKQPYNNAQLVSNNNKKPANDNAQNVEDSYTFENTNENIPWHLQSYDMENDIDFPAVQVIDNSLTNGKSG